MSQASTLPLPQALADLLQRHHAVCSTVYECQKLIAGAGGVGREGGIN
jgi:hypothetical protein